MGRLIGLFCLHNIGKLNLQELILHLLNSVNESHFETFITFPVYSWLTRGHGDWVRAGIKGQFSVLGDCALCLESFRQWSYLILSWGLLSKKDHSLKIRRSRQMGEGLSGRPAITGFIHELPFEISLSKFPSFLLNDWNFLIPCALSARINLNN